MKKLIFATVLLLSTINIFAQSKIKTETIKVNGTCNQCKERIEEAAYTVGGVKKAMWNKKTRLLTVTYNTGKTTIEAITNAEINIGHDANNLIAVDSIYTKLPACCAYRSGVSCKH
jgi:periplasmic mercuric ion binding protein